jgi:hypothetical protein
MSEEWKGDRAEAEMRKGTEAIRLAAEKKSEQEEIMKWDNLKTTLCIGNEDRKDDIDYVINLLQSKFELPEKKSIT